MRKHSEMRSLGSRILSEITMHSQSCDYGIFYSLIPIFCYFILEWWCGNNYCTSSIEAIICGGRLLRQVWVYITCNCAVSIKLQSSHKPQPQKPQLLFHILRRRLPPPSSTEPPLLPQLTPLSASWCLVRLATNPVPPAHPSTPHCHIATRQLSKVGTCMDVVVVARAKRFTGWWWELVCEHSCLRDVVGMARLPEEDSPEVFFLHSGFFFTCSWCRKSMLPWRCYLGDFTLRDTRHLW